MIAPSFDSKKQAYVTWGAIRKRARHNMLGAAQQEVHGHTFECRVAQRVTWMVDGERRSAFDALRFMFQLYEDNK